MKKSLKLVLFNSTLVIGLMASVLSVVQVPVQGKSKETSYLIAYKKDLPDDFEEQIEEAGGKVGTVVEEIGIVSATSDDPDFFDNVAAFKDVLSAEEELEILLDEEEPEAADGQMITDVPQPDWDDPDQTYHDLQWDVKRITNDFASHEISKGDSGTVVGIIDTGMDFDHPDLRNNADEEGSKTFVPGTDDAWDENGHGTHVAGSIAGDGKVLGIGPKLTVRAYRVFGATGGAQQSWITDALVAAANDKVDVVNMSLGGWRWMAHNYGEKGESASIVAYHRAVQYAVKKGVTVVVAAGNDSRELGNIKDMREYWKETYGLDIKGPSRVVPAQIPGVITVSATNEWSDEKIAFYSNYGNPIDIAAPGGDNGPVYDELYREDPKGDYLDKRDFHYRTISTWPTYLPPYFTSNLKGYAYLHGTSMAAPKVAGIAAVIKSEHPNYSPVQVAALIRKTADDYGKRGQDKYFGAGEANIFNALED
ncbi:S8 family serine peptidase [Brevibacillus sp. NRS-1366]|uniref:S8 family serine peptidase n=1 Tax=Brevibacillus sp. NRS-1366 TaxID=3233899 RepID=UPI003D1AF6E7